MALQAVAEMLQTGILIKQRLKNQVLDLLSKKLYLGSGIEDRGEVHLQIRTSHHENKLSLMRPQD